MEDNEIRRRLMTTLSAAVRIGRSTGLSDSQVGAELADLADLYLAAVQPVRMPGVSRELLGIEEPPWSTEAVGSKSTPSGVCGFSLDVTTHSLFHDAEVIAHVHRCQKALGHADGLGGSDHQCESCGALYDAAGGTASPLGLTGLPLGGNGRPDGAQEIEL